MESWGVGSLHQSWGGGILAFNSLFKNWEIQTSPPLSAFLFPNPLSSLSPQYHKSQKKSSSHRNPPLCPFLFFRLSPPSPPPSLFAFFHNRNIFNFALKFHSGSWECVFFSSFFRGVSKTRVRIYDFFLEEKGKGREGLSVCLCQTRQWSSIFT